MYSLFQIFIDDLAKGTLAASHIPEANTWRVCMTKLDSCVMDKLMDGIPIGLLRAT